MSPPGSWTAGDSVSWTVSAAGYPASSGWVLSYSFETADGIVKIAEADSPGNDEDYSVSLTASQTADWVAGEANWAVFVRKGEERKTLSTGVTRLRPDPEKAHPSYAREQLRLVEDAIRARNENDTPERSTIGGQSFDKIPYEQLLSARSYWVREVGKENNRKRRLATGRRSPRAVRQAFTG